MKSITLQAKAKINLFLEVTGKRENGYHNISTVMHSIDLFDNITISRNSSSEITISSDSTSMPLDRKNIAYKCADAFFDAINEKNRGTNIDIQKNIPMEAGLAGGSTDGAAVLKGLNELFGKPLSISSLCDIAKNIGADIPFCIVGGAMLAEGIGDIMTPCSTLPDCHILIAKGSEGVSTKEAYSHLDSITDRKIYNNNMPKLLKNGDLKDICNGMYNCFELLVPSVESIKKTMTDNGALSAMMTGSGSAVFGVFEDKKDAERAKKEFLNNNIFATVC